MTVSANAATLRPMDDRDVEVRNLTYRLFVELGRAPTAGEAAERHGSMTPDVLAAWARLHQAHALVLNPGMTEIRMANPFSAVPSAYRVRAGDRWWYANCAWDAFGICAALHCDGTIEASCPDCGEPLTVRVSDKQPDNDALLFHCLVAAAQWWDDIAFT